MRRQCRTAASAVAALLGVAVLAACGSGAAAGGRSTSTTTSASSASTSPGTAPTSTGATSPPATSIAPATATSATASSGAGSSTGAASSGPGPSPGSATPAPSWLGRRVLPLRPDGYGVMGRTPAELDPRDIATVDVLPPPADGRFRSTVSVVPPSVVARSTWAPGCPVDVADLRYVTVSFVGFDARPHTGELLVHRTAAAAMVRIFATAYAARFPIERMVVATVAERDAPPTGDGNTTGAFNCRSAAGTTRWSQHAYGLALDVNPFMNPYVRRDVVLPELASTYRDRGDVRPGMLTGSSAVVRAFAAEGWVWGGRWKSLKDYMHFSPSGT